MHYPPNISSLYYLTGSTSVNDGRPVLQHPTIQYAKLEAEYVTPTKSPSSLLCPCTAGHAWLENSHRSRDKRCLRRLLWSEGNCFFWRAERRTAEISSEDTITCCFAALHIRTCIFYKSIGSGNTRLLCARRLHLAPKREQEEVDQSVALGLKHSIHCSLSRCRRAQLSSSIDDRLSSIPTTSYQS